MPTVTSSSQTIHDSLDARAVPKVTHRPRAAPGVVAVIALVNPHHLKGGLTAAKARSTGAAMRELPGARSTTPGAQDDVGDVQGAGRRVDAGLDRVQLDREVLARYWPAETRGVSVTGEVSAAEPEQARERCHRADGDHRDRSGYGNRLGGDGRDVVER